MAEIIPFPHNSIEKTLAPLETLGESSKQKLKQILHDLRSPLGVFEVAVEKHLCEGPIFSRAFKRLEHGLDEMEKLIREQKTVQMENGEAKPRDLSSLVNEIVQEKCLTFNLDSEHFLFTPRTSLPPLAEKVDEYELGRIISNLLNNALEAGNNGPLKLSQSIRQGFHELTISDNGPGISPSELEKLSHSPLSFKSHGKGLGLTHARNTLAKWEGSLSVSSRWGQGSAFSIRIPAARPKLLKGEK